VANADGIASDFGIEFGGDLFTLLDLEQIDDDIFRGLSSRTTWQRAFGGQVAAQALVAAGRTVSSDRPVHSLHSYFLRPGDSDIPIVYQVDRVRDGRSFTTRRVVAIQHGQPIFVLSASFQLAQDGIEHQIPMPDAPDPETLPTLAALYARADPSIGDFQQEHPIDLRFVDDPPWITERTQAHPGHHRVWMRVPTPLSDDPLMHVCALTFASDMTLLDSVLIRHGLMVGRDVTAMASLDHAMWFMHPMRADEWFLYNCWSPASAGGRGLASGQFYDRSGRLLALVVQEGMIRTRRG
jgi:acyl-CoA thioesterase-2